MKKFFVLFSVMVLTISLSAAVKTQPFNNTDIANMIKRTAPLNYQLGVKNPDLIYPDQQLYYRSADGETEYFVNVIRGNSQWSISKGIFLGNYSPWKPFTAVDPKKDDISPEKPQISSVLPFGLPTFILALLVAMLILAIWLYSNRIKERNADPVTAGEPQVKGGVNDAHAHERMSQLAEQRYPGARLEIRNIRRGRLNGVGKVFYADSKKPKTRRMNNVPAFAGEITVNGREETIFFLQGCGNDVRQGNYMKEFEFTPEVQINQDGSESPLPIQAPVVETQEQSSVPVIPADDLTSESFRLRSKSLEILKDVLTSSDVHEFTLDTTPEGGLKMNVKYKSEKVSGIDLRKADGKQKAENKEEKN